MDTQAFLARSHDMYRASGKALAEVYDRFKELKQQQASTEQIDRELQELVRSKEEQLFPRE